ncbi:hypothetical protein CEXT_108231 [Caerostris extrusa]|uniref:Uncharacterized protein n=1 Tax=Caerostris extrusa TaxID=172846 RepID=A0AAV4RZW8_CAEEX|nr:hypothetical protein CEXT_108231 [Caerostris extrusa]
MLSGYYPAPSRQVGSDSCLELDIPLFGFHNLVENDCMARGECLSSAEGRFLSFGACLSTTPADKYENLFYGQQSLAAATTPHQVYQKAPINSQIEMDSSIHTAASLKRYP